MSRLRLGDEGGFSLVFTMLTMLVTTVTLTAAIQYTTSNSRHSTRSKADQIAYSLAEAGLANGAAVLSKPSNNALDPNVLPSWEPSDTNPAHANYISQYEGGKVKWWGVLTGHQWIMHGVGYVSDPTGKTQVVRREATSTIKIHAVAEAGAELERLELHVREGHAPAPATSRSRTASASTPRSSSWATSASRTRPRS